MRLGDPFTDIYESLSWTEAHAEAAPEDREENSKGEGGDEKSEDKEDGGDDGEKEEGVN